MSDKKNLTYTTVDGKRYPNQFRDNTGKVKQSPKGKYYDQFGRLKPIPKSKKKTSTKGKKK